MAETVRILVADDHPIVREGLVAILETQDDFDVVGQAGNGREALDLINALDPDVLLLDLEMPEVDGLGVLEALRDNDARQRVIVFTVFDTDDRILSAVRAGAKGYLLKGAPREEIFNAVRVVHQGGSLLQPIVASRLLEHVNRSGDDPDALTPRELEVLPLLAQGLLNKEIADALDITERTVKFHVSSILAKLRSRQPNRSRRHRRAKGSRTTERVTRKKPPITCCDRGFLSFDIRSSALDVRRSSYLHRRPKQPRKDQKVSEPDGVVAVKIQPGIVALPLPPSQTRSRMSENRRIRQCHPH